MLFLRPYSFVTPILAGILASVTSRGLVFDTSLALDAALGLSVWCLINLISEFAQGDKTEVGKATLAGAFIVTFLLVFYRGTLPIAVFFLGLLSLPLYSLKTRDLPVSPISFLFRGFAEASIMLIVVFTYTGLSAISLQEIIPVVAVYLVTCSRNLVGDLRDMEHDSFTFPVKFGENPARLISILLLAPVFYLIGDLLVVTPLVLAALILIFYRNYYRLHRMYVLITAFFVVNLLLSSTGGQIWILNLLLLGVLLNFTYREVPREANPDV